MASEIFVISLAVIFTGMLGWGFRNLPAEKWQVLCCVPVDKHQDGMWHGYNLTYYGFFNAAACLIGVGLLIALTGAMAIPAGVLLWVVAIIFMVCIPASRLIARMVEKKGHTSTIGGAFFTGLLIAPWILWLINDTIGIMMGFRLPVIEILAALMIAYTVGEGIGRLGCISFGCCYGRPLEQTGSFLKILFKHWTFIFEGKTKKIAYAHHYDGLKVIPVQALTAFIFAASALAGAYLFLKGHAVFVLAGLTVVTQGWRIFSEYLRADYRGEGTITVYQWMATASVLYAFLLIAFTAPSTYESPDIFRGLQALWSPGIIIFMEFLGFFVFLYTGKSSVTESKIALYVLDEKI